MEANHLLYRSHANYGKAHMERNWCLCPSAPSDRRQVKPAPICQPCKWAILVIDLQLQIYLLQPAMWSRNKLYELLLMHTKLQQTQWLKISSNLLDHSFAGQNSGEVWLVLCSLSQAWNQGVSQTEFSSRGSAAQISLPALSGCWQSSVSCSYTAEISFSFTCASLHLQASNSSLYPHASNL